MFFVTSNIPHNILHILFECGEDSEILLVPRNIVVNVNNVMHNTLFSLHTYLTLPPPISRETPYCCIFLNGKSLEVGFF